MKSGSPIALAIALFMSLGGGCDGGGGLDVPDAPGAVLEPVPAATPLGDATVLVLFDSSGPWGSLGELYALYLGNLAGHFGRATAMPVAGYSRGALARYSATFYVGSTFDEPLPEAFLDDVLATDRPVLWLNDNIWQLVARAGAGEFRARYGFEPHAFTSYEGCPVAGRCSPVNHVTYKGRSLARDGARSGALMDYVAPAPATVLATAHRDDGSTLPWAVRGHGLTYVGELPSYVHEGDRTLILSDLLFDLLAPSTPERHRALVRIEDVSAAGDPSALRAFVDYLAGQGVPFSIATIPVYVDPHGADHGGSPTTLRLRDAPEMVEALRYAERHGGTLLMHGYTHQYRDVANPLSGISADDYEFFRSHVEGGVARLDGPVAEDSHGWAASRLEAGLRELIAAGFARPYTFEAPHYAASAATYDEVRRLFSRRYERSVYFSGQLGGGALDQTRLVGQYFPYPVVDAWGTLVVPENLGNVEPVPFLGNPPRLPRDIVASAEANRVVRDGVASFFIHTDYGLPALREIVEGIGRAGYTFVAADAL